MILNATPAFRLHVSLAETPEQVAACRALIAETYLREYGVRMTPDEADPNGLRERMPDRYAMGVIGEQLVACAGLYIGRTYIEEYGQVTGEEIDRVLTDAGVWDPSPRVRVEYTKVVVREGWGRRGIGRLFIGATHSHTFLEVDGRTPVLLVCAKLSILRMWRLIGIRTRLLKEFPAYRNHDRYRASGDPMESRVIIPELDIHRRWYDPTLPTTLSIDVLGGILAE